MGTNSNRSMQVSIVIDATGLKELTHDFEKLAGPVGFEHISPFEKTLAEAFVAVKANVHVLTGGLLASGVTSTHFDGGTWSGTIEFAADPGIFELARGDTPSLNHPEGGHFFFDPFYDFEDAFVEDMARWFGESLGLRL